MPLVSNGCEYVLITFLRDPGNFRKSNVDSKLVACPQGIVSNSLYSTKLGWYQYTCNDYAIDVLLVDVNTVVFVALLVMHLNKAKMLYHTFLEVNVNVTKLQREKTCINVCIKK